MPIVVKEAAHILPNGEYVASRVDFRVTPELNFIFYQDTLTKKITMTNGVESLLQFDFIDREFKSLMSKLEMVYRRIPETREEIFFDKLKIKYEFGHVFIRSSENEEAVNIRIGRVEMAKFIRFRPLLIQASEMRLNKRY